jgi:hypothetical protein
MKRRVIPKKELKGTITSINLTASDRKYVDIIAADNDCTMSEVVRYGISLVIKKYKKSKGISDSVEDDVDD